MDARCSLALCGFLVATIAAVVPAEAATVNYNLAGNPAGIVNIVTPGDPFIDQALALTDADTGSSQLPGGVIAVGDVVNVKINFASEFTMPASSVGAALEVALDQATQTDSFSITESVSYYKAGVQIAPPTEFTNILNGGSRLVLGQAAGDLSSPSFLFDEIVYSATIDSIVQIPGGNVSSAILLPTVPQVDVLYEPSPVPLPAAFWLLLSGAGSLSLLVRKR